MIRRFGAMFGLAALVLVMGVSGAVAQDQPMVNMVDGAAQSDYKYDPLSMGVAVGDTVVWTNAGSEAHTVTADDGSFDSGDVDPGGTFSYTFGAPGTFSYSCAEHPWMTGKITVG